MNIDVDLPAHTCGAAHPPRGVIHEGPGFGKLAYRERRQSARGADDTLLQKIVFCRIVLDSFDFAQAANVPVLIGVL